MGCCEFLPRCVKVIQDHASGGGKQLSKNALPATQSRELKCETILLIGIGNDDLSALQVLQTVQYRLNQSVVICLNNEKPLTV